MGRNGGVLEGCGEVLGRVLVGGKGQRWGSVKVWGVMGVLGGGEGGSVGNGGQAGGLQASLPPTPKRPRTLSEKVSQLEVMLKRLRGELQEVRPAGGAVGRYGAHYRAR